MPNIPGTQPRSVIIGNLIAALVGVLAIAILGNSMWAAALAAGIAMLAMNAAKVFHIPSVATAALVVLVNPTDKFAFVRLIVGASIFLSFMGFLFSKLTGKIKYPLYW